MGKASKSILWVVQCVGLSQHALRLASFLNITAEISVPVTFHVLRQLQQFRDIQRIHTTLFSFTRSVCLSVCVRACVSEWVWSPWNMWSVCNAVTHIPPAFLFFTNLANSDQLQNRVTQPAQFHYSIFTGFRIHQTFQRSDFHRILQCEILDLIVTKED